MKLVTTIGIIMEEVSSVSSQVAAGAGRSRLMKAKSSELAIDLASIYPNEITGIDVNRLNDSYAHNDVVRYSVTKKTKNKKRKSEINKV